MMKVNILGDLVVTNRLRSKVKKGQYASVISNISDHLRNSDYNIVNLESPILEKGSPIDKLGPNLKSSPETIGLLKEGKFNVCALANNHIMDFGNEGLKKTLSSLIENDIAYLGVGKNINEAAEPLILEKGGNRIGIINIAEHEFNLATKNKPGANPLDSIQNHYQIKELKGRVDKTIVIVHGGHEHYEYPSPRMQDTYRFFIDSGVDVVVGHHPHCYSGYEEYNNGLIFYSLGNFIFDKKGIKNEKWNYGFILSLEIGSEEMNFEVIPFNQCSEEPIVYRLSDKEFQVFKYKFEEINSVIKDREELEAKFEKYCEQRLAGAATLFEPYENRYLKALRYRSLIPSVLSRKKYLRLYNYLFCQAHRDVVEYKLEKEIQ